MALTDSLPDSEIVSFLTGQIKRDDSRFFVITEGFPDEVFLKKHLTYAYRELKSGAPPDIGWKSPFEFWPIARTAEQLGIKSGHSRSQVLKVSNHPALESRENFVCIIDWDLVHFKTGLIKPLGRHSVAIDALEADDVLATDLESLFIQTGTKWFLNTLGFQNIDILCERFVPILRDAAFNIGSFHAAREKLNAQFSKTATQEWKPSHSWLKTEEVIATPHKANHPERALLNLAKFDCGLCESSLRTALESDPQWNAARIEKLFATAKEIRDSITDESERWRVCRGKDLVALLEIMLLRPNRSASEPNWVMEKLPAEVQWPDISNRPFMQRITQVLHGFLQTQSHPSALA
jgi:hypothetical protein